MKFIGVALIVLFFNSSFASSSTPLNVVNNRMDAYNKHDLERLISNYSEDVRIYTYPDIKLATGKNHLRSIFKPMFEEGEVKVTILYQVVRDSFVINHEEIDYLGSKSEHVSIYKVKDGLITEVRFVRD